MSQQAKFKVGELVVVGKMNEEKWEPSFKPEECCFGGDPTDFIVGGVI